MPETEAKTEDLTAILAKAQNSQSPQRDAIYLQAAEKMITQQAFDDAGVLLQLINPIVLGDLDFLLYCDLYSAQFLHEDSFFLARDLLSSPRLELLLPNADLQRQWSVRNRRADIQWLLGETDASINERLLLQQLKLTESQSTTNQDRLWHTLMTLPTEQLQQSAALQLGTEAQGWHQLAQIAKDYQSDLNTQYQRVNDWRETWPTHPGSLRLPKELHLLQQMIAQEPKVIALLLPQHGRLAQAGQAVRDGMMAAYYQAQAAGLPTPEIQLYDSTQTASPDLAEQAVARGVDLIIGPLEKNQVQALLQASTMDTPVLALNYVQDSPQQVETSFPFYQLGLSAEDEARQIAHKAWIDGHRRALILATNADWGIRSASAFRQAWEELGGIVIDATQFTGNGDYSQTIAASLQIEQSKARYRAIRNLFGQQMEFEPRRRQDVDMVFMVAQPSQARQVKPTLAFHYASELPVYATSHIYNGGHDPKANRDLNGVHFLTMPWLLQDETGPRFMVERISTPPAAFLKLYALGFDAYRIYPRLLQLAQSPDIQLDGVTGALSMNTGGQIKGRQVWAEFNRGEARRLPIQTHE